MEDVINSLQDERLKVIELEKQVNQLKDNIIAKDTCIEQLEAELEEKRLYAGGLENAQGYLDEKIENLQAELKKLNTNFLRTLVERDELKREVLFYRKQALEGSKENG